MSQAASMLKLCASARSISLTTALVVGITLLALGLRLYCLDCWALWYDEVTSIRIAQGGPESISATRFGWPGNQPPAYFLVLWLLTLAADPTQTAVFVRLPSIVAGVLAVPLLYALGRDTLGRATGVLAAALLALSLPALNYSQDARQYSATLLLSLAAFYSLIRIRAGGGGKWWTAFTVAMTANVLYSYLAVTLVAPVMALLAAWVLGERWKHRSQLPFSWASPLVAAAVVGVAVILSGFEPVAVSGLPVDPGNVPLSSYVLVLIRDWVWLLRFGFPGDLSVQVALYLLVLALVGTAMGVRSGGIARAVSVYSVLLIVVPHIELAVIASSRVVLPRYALFILPQVLLLVAHGVLALARIVSTVPARRWPVFPIIVRAAGAALLVGLFVVGAARYYDPKTSAADNTRSDPRRVASFLREVGRPKDTIVVTSEPSQASMVLDFYLKGSPPAPTYDALDPLLFDHPAPRRLIVVIGGLANTDLATYFREQTETLRYSDGVSTGVLVLEGNGRTMLELMEAWAKPFVSAVPSGRLPAALYGSLYQAAGETGQAAAAYAQARVRNPEVPLWREYIATADGFDARGHRLEAWNQLMVAKYEGSNEPEVHWRLAQSLASMGFHEQAQLEERIAAALAALPAGAANKD